MTHGQLVMVSANEREKERVRETESEERREEKREMEDETSHIDHDDVPSLTEPRRLERFTEPSQ
jgi:hypothetical protein